MPKKKEPEGGKGGKGKRRPQARLNFGVTRAVEQFEVAQARLAPKVEKWETKRRLAVKNGRRFDRIRAERMKHQIHAQILSARGKLLEFALTVNFPGRVEELRNAGIVSKKQAQAELDQIKGTLERTGQIVKELMAKERRGPIIDPNPDPNIMLANYNSLLAELDLAVKKQRPVTISAKRTGTPKQVAQAQIEELVLTGRQASARIEMIHFLIDNPLLRRTNGYKTEAEAVKAIEIESKKFTSADRALELLNRNRRKS